MMRKFLLAGVMVVALGVPAQAHATGNHTPAPPAAKTCACCGDLSQRIDRLELVYNQRFAQQDTRITNVENRLSVVENRLENLNNYIVQIDQRTTQIINRIDPLSCTSSRKYTFRLRTEVDGVPVASVRGVEAAGAPGRGSVRRSKGRFVITANYAGITAPALQFRTVMVHVTLANGQKADLVQYVRLCGARDGDPNGIPAQNRAGR
jgi:hypothetical protein